jgi:flagellin
MPMSINSNYGASIALQNLNQTNSQLDEVQNRISTGLKVASAKDNGAVFAIAEGQRARISSISAVKDGMTRASNALDIGMAAGASIGQVLQSMKSIAVKATAEDLSSAQRAAYQADYDEMRNNINTIANASVSNGINLVAAGGSNINVVVSDVATGTTGRQVTSTATAGYVPGLSAYVVNATTGVTAADDTQLRLNGNIIGTVDITATMTIQQYLDGVGTATGGRVTAAYDQSTGQFTYRANEAVVTTNELSVTGAGTARAWLGQGVAAGAVTGGTTTSSITDRDFTAGGSGALTTVSLAGSLLSTASSSSTTSGNLDTAITALNQQLATMGAQAKALTSQNDFLGKLSDVVESGVSNLVDADLAKESARLQSLQVKQQLGAQALSIANQSPSLILSFFR